MCTTKVKWVLSYPYYQVDHMDTLECQYDMYLFDFWTIIIISMRTKSLNPPVFCRWNFHCCLRLAFHHCIPDRWRWAGCSSDTCSSHTSCIRWIGECDVHKGGKAAHFRQRQPLAWLILWPATTPVLHASADLPPWRPHTLRCFLYAHKES